MEKISGKKKSICWKEVTSIKKNNKIANYVKIKQRVRRGYVLSMNIFPCYSEIIMRGSQKEQELKLTDTI